ncbi:MAG: hypothetical protein AMXMBFR61_11530 [Fimbriimonadales bacterium]
MAFIEARGFYLAAMRIHPEHPGAVAVGKRVLEANAPARRKGVEDGMLLTSAYSFAPELTVLEYDRDRERETKRRWLNPCARVSSLIEPVSPHAAFVDLSHAPTPGQELHDLLRAIAEAIAGITPVAGLSTNKTLAVLACRRATEEWSAATVQPPEPNRREQPFFSFFLPKRAQAEFLRRLPVVELPVDPGLLQRILRLGMHTLGNLLPVPEAEMVRRFGPEGRRLYQLIRGHDPEPVRALYPPRTLTLHSPSTEIDNEQVALWVLDKVADAASEHLTREDGWARHIILEVETEKDTLVQAAELPSPIREPARVRSVCRRLFRRASPASAIHRLTLRMELDPAPATGQPDLFSDPMAAARRTLLESAVRWACRRFGERAVLRDPPSPRRERLRAFYELPG